MADFALEEWTYHLLTLAPPAVLEVTSPNSPTAATFAHARSRGYTVWSPPSQGASRSTFLKEAVSRVYHEKMLQRHPTVQITTHLEANLETTSSPTEGLLSPRQRIAAHAAEIRAKRNDPAFKALLPSEERPMSNFPDVLSKLETSPLTEDYTSTLSSSSLTPSASLFPPFSGSSTPLTIQTPSRSSTLEKQFISSSTVTLSPQIRDPVDVAVDRLVKMGFEERKAKKALAETDSGNSIDFDKALEMLVRERKRDVSSLMNWNYRGAIGDDEQEAKPGSSTIGLGIAGAERYA